MCWRARWRNVCTSVRNGVALPLVLLPPAAAFASGISGSPCVSATAEQQRDDRSRGQRDADGLERLATHIVFGRRTQPHGLVVGGLAHVVEPDLRVRHALGQL